MVFMEMACKRIYTFLGGNEAIHHVARVKPVVENKYAIVGLQCKATMKYVCKLKHFFMAFMLIRTKISKK